MVVGDRTEVEVRAARVARLGLVWVSLPGLRARCLLSNTVGLLTAVLAAIRRDPGGGGYGLQRCPPNFGASVAVRNSFCQLRGMVNCGWCSFSDSEVACWTRLRDGYPFMESRYVFP